MAGCLVLEGVENFGEFFFKEREKRMQKDGEEREMHAEPEREREVHALEMERRETHAKRWREELRGRENIWVHADDSHAWSNCSA